MNSIPLNHEATEATDDLRALAWVQDELRRSLELAHKALRRHLKEAEGLVGSDVDAVDPAVLRGARTHLHQGAGALELIGLDAPARVLRGSEAAVQRLVQRPALATLQAVETIEKVSFALLDYLTRLLAGKQVSPIALFPQYRDVQALAGADRVHPADLWHHAWRWEDVADEPGVPPREMDPAARSQLEALMLTLMRYPSRQAMQRMSDFCASLGMGSRGRLSTLWKLASAVFEAQAAGLLRGDVYAKRVAPRLLAQARAGSHPADVSERLAQDLLFFCATADTSRATVDTPRLRAVQRAFGFIGSTLPHYETARLGRFDPSWIAQARKRVAGARDAWSAVAGGEMHRLHVLGEQFALVGESLQKLYPSGERLSAALLAAAAQTVHSGEAPPVPLAMEVATSVLYLDASLEDAELDHPELAGRIERLAQRVDAVRAGAEPEPLEAWMEELYRRVSDRQTMGSVVQELRASLSEVEKQIDQYFRDPYHREVLIPVPAQLQSMRGVFSVLGMEQASHALVQMRDEVDQLAQTEVDAEHAARAGTFDRLADNLGSLSFLIDMLGVQPQLAKSVFEFDPASGRLAAVMGRSGRTAVAAGSPGLIDQAQQLAQAAVANEMSDDTLAGDLGRLAEQAVLADQRGLADTITNARDALAQATGDDERRALRNELAHAVGELATPLPATPVPPPVPLPAPGDDAEMREIFIEEAREVVDGARAALVRQTEGADPQETALADLTEIRRAFHTLKGSSRMVGLGEFGEAAWACEQLYNSRLAGGDSQLDDPMARFTAQALDVLQAWVDAIDAGDDAERRAAPVVRAAEALRLEGRLEAIEGAPVRPVAPPPSLDPYDGPAYTTRVQGPPVEPAAPLVDPASLPPITLQFDDEEDDAPTPAPLTLPPLDQAVPGLPSASELDLGSADAPPALPDVIESLPTGDAAEVAFDLDLGGFGADGAAAQAASLPPVFDEPVPFELPPLAEATAPSAAFDAPVPQDPLPAWDAPAAELPPLDVPSGFDLRFDETADPTATAPLPEVPWNEPAAVQAPPVADVPPVVDDESVKVVGPLRIDITMFNIYLNEADELSRRLGTALAEWATAPAAPPGETPVVLAHSLAGSSGTVGFADLSTLARALEHALMRSNDSGRVDPLEPGLYGEAADDIRRLLHQFAAGFLKAPTPGLIERLNDHQPVPAAGLVQGYDDPFQTMPMPGPLPVPVAPEGFPTLTDEVADGADTAGPSGLVDVPLEAASETPFETPFGAPFETPLETPVETPVETSVDAAVDAPAVADAPAWPVDADALPDAMPLPPFEPSFDALVEASPAPMAAPAVDPLAAPVAEPLPFSPSTFELPLSPPADPWAAVPAAQTEPGLPAAFHAAEGAAPLPGATSWAALDDVPPAAPVATARADAFDDEDDLDSLDSIDPDLFPIFADEAEELLPQLQSRMRDWARRPVDSSAAAACMRTLHTFKGGARLAGAMRLGEMAHRLETAIEHLLARGDARPVDIEPLVARVDAIESAFEQLRTPGGVPAPVAPEPRREVVADLREPTEPLPTAVPVDAPISDFAPMAGPAPVEPLALTDVLDPALSGTATPVSWPAEPPAESSSIDWTRFSDPAPDTTPAADRPVAVGSGAVRVRGPLLDRLVNQAGEVSIARARIEADVGQLKTALADLTENLDRLRRQLRDIEVQAESQISSRMEAAKASAEAFDPLEMDRFTRFQELTRMMAESVNDVATVQRGLQRTLQSTEDELAAQARLTRSLQDDLLRTRMVEFEALADRLYRVVRQAAKETGKQVRLDIVGGATEIDRGVLDRMTAPFEHLLRNSVTHGIEAPTARESAGKDATGAIGISLAQEGNEVAIEFRDDGAGLNLERIRERGIAAGLIQPDAQPTEAELADLIFTPGFSTASSVTELAGRGVGMDVVRSEVVAMGGRIETGSAPGQGTRFRLVLPLTTAVTQVVLLRCGELTVAVPSTLVEGVRRLPTEAVEEAYATGTLRDGEATLPFFWLGALLQGASRGGSVGRTQAVAIIRSAAQRVALHLDEVVGNQEVVVKNLGPQLSRLPGLAGMTLLPSGTVAPIYNPVALAALYGDAVRARLRADDGRTGPDAGSAAAAEPLAPLVLVVDDSLTVRRVTQRLLVREGYRVTTAKDGLDALERLAEEKPAIVLSDIEMPRMDGFDLVRNLRADARLADLAVIMITSRIAQKHRDYAAELGVDHYLGKPYAEEELLSLIERYVRGPVSQH